MSDYKRILFFTKPSKKQIADLCLDIFEDGCYGRIVIDGNVADVLKKAQSSGLRCRFLVIAESEFASWGLIDRDMIICGAQ
jgi:hypothetical protein